MLSFLYSLDVFILEFVNLSYHNIITNNLALLISYLGILATWIVLSILLYIFGGEKGKNVAKKLIIVLIVVSVLTQIIKFLVMRPRPYTELSSLVVLATENDMSFPSGHTSISTAMAYVLSKEYKNWYFMLIPLMVGLSRLYIGVHYPSDVIGGFILGLIIAYLLERYLKQKQMNPQMNVKEKTLKD